MSLLHASLRGALLAALVASGACTDQLTDAPAARFPGDTGPRASAAAALPRVDFRVMIDTITDAIIQDSTGEYQQPPVAARNHFALAADSVAAGNAAFADSLLEQYDYEVVTVADTVANDTFVVIRERVPAGDTVVARGWGTFVYNPTHAHRADIHVNHPIDDKNTEDMAGDLYRSCGCRWFLMAGARRYANSSDISDTARDTTTVFHRMHRTVARAGTRALSIHGFKIGNHTDSIPADAEVVLSNGRNRTTKIPVYTAADSTLRTRLNAAGFVAGLYRADTLYKDLGATTNPQGRHSNDTLGWGRWMHLEHERALRDDSVQWKQSNAILRQWIIDHP